MKINIRRRGLLLLAAAGAAIGLAGGIAYASIPDASGVIHGCRNNGSGLLRVIDSAGQSCTQAETPLNWVQSSGHEVFRFSSPVEITGTNRATGNHVMTLNLPGGAYVVTTQITATGAGDWAVICSSLAAHDVRGPQEGDAQAAIGTGAGDSRLTSFLSTFTANIPSGDGLSLSCWKVGAGSGANPVVTVADMVAVKVGAVTTAEDEG
jgi:hypothetical protein